MQETACPICCGPLEVREVAPCAECGAVPDELEHLRQNKHTYAVYELYDEIRVTLCLICALEIGSIRGDFFGLTGNSRLDYTHLRLVRQIENPSAGRDKYCPACGSRLAYLRFVDAVRKRSARQLES